MKPTVSIALLVALGLSGCGGTAGAKPTPTATLSYGDCVAQFTMDPDKVQEYIDAVYSACGEPPD